MTELRVARALMLAVAGTVALGAATTAWGHFASVSVQEELLALREESGRAQRLMSWTTEVESSFRGHLLDPAPSRRERVLRALGFLQGEEAAETLVAAEATLGPSEAGALRESLRRMVAQRRHGLALVDGGGREQVLDSLRGGGAQMTVDEIHDSLGNLLAHHGALAKQREAQLDRINDAVLGLVLGSALLTLAALATAWRLVVRRSRAADAAGGALRRKSAEMAALLGAGDLLQACEGVDDVSGVVAHAAGGILPGVPGRLYLFRNSRDRLDLAHAWNDADGAPAPQAQFAPDACWALRRGRPHRQGEGGLRCRHADAGPGWCVPMQARGDLHGVLHLRGAPLEGAGSAVPALADAASLALANLGLRERLRAQAMRDPMTGLSNRRFLEEVAEGVLLGAGRRGAPVTVALLDADHFKRVNDEHGHAAGDAVLRAIAGAVQAGVRRSDVACRYGGEEFLLLMPDCGPEEARGRLERLREEASRLRVAGVPGVTVSIGFACVPDDASGLEAAVAAADAALYAAKAAGRDRVSRAGEQVAGWVAGGVEAASGSGAGNGSADGAGRRVA